MIRHLLASLDNPPCIVRGDPLSDRPVQLLEESGGFLLTFTTTFVSWFDEVDLPALRIALKVFGSTTPVASAFIPYDSFH